MDVSKRVLTKAYEYEDTISLDKDWIRKVSGDKEVSDERTVLISESTYEEMKYASNIDFNYEYYDGLVDMGEYNEANEYIDENCKDTKMQLDDYIIEYADDLDEIIEHGFNGKLTVITK